MSEDEIEKVVYGYTTNINELEEKNKALREVISSLKDELEKFKRSPLMVCEVRDVTGENAIIRVPNGNEFFVELSRDCGKIAAGDTVLVEQRNFVVIKKIPLSKKFNVNSFVIVEKPKVSWSDVGGLDKQVREIKEVIELPLKKPELFKKIGIEPPKGILLYGPPGTGKTLLAKAVAASTKSTFIEVVGSELVQKFIGEGAKLVKEMFELARENAPSIVFIDELDALASKRMEIGTSGEREVNRTFMQLLAEIDGFKNLGDVKIVGCTNRKDILDDAILRPGRLDRLIEVPIPNKEARLSIFRIHTKRMELDTNINVNRIVNLMDNFSGAEIKAVATEAGYFAIRSNRTNITQKDLTSAVEKVKQQEAAEGRDYLSMFG